ncbi:ABC-2 type transport system ATP-binding protein [Acidovorax sp. 62]|uniref:ATP-binding cassette domain-containing protein n=1 Tax=Acidovorax sp. 62 TaxID=2035203 RepID=UPI000C195B7A|nr:ABC transporter ATP-binding protein [Acidovorax sp. 62]PIF93258.1 ABC-2 type transport system ATP-binding protein [Acidovorax sp. 62]
MIQIEGLHYGYGRAALYADFSAQIGQPGIYGVFGRNGSGKSTLLRLLCGLLTPWQGRVRVLGFQPRQRAAEFLASVYIVPEEFHLPNLTAAQLARTHGSFYPRFSHALFSDYLQVLDVPVDSRFEAMSLGQKKKAAIAFALATQTPLLLMDEPTNGLDIVGRGQFRELMRRPEQAQRVVMISTHQAHDLESILSHIWFIDQGRLALAARMDELAERLTMGVAATAQALPTDGLLYQEALGAQVAYVARRVAGVPEEGALQLELLYKALSLNRDAMLQALATADGARTAEGALA